MEYSVDGGSNWTQKAANQSVAKNDSETLTQSVADGTAITWRYKSSTSSGSFSGSYTTLSASSTVDCPYIDTTVSQSLGSCSSGSATSTLTLANSNSANTTAYFYVRYKIDSGNWNTVVTNQSVAKNASTTLTQSVPHGSVITWTYLTSTTSNTFSGSGTEVASSTVNCLYIDPSASQSLAGSCSGGYDTSTLTLANSNSANTTAYFLVEYSVDGGSNWTQHGSSNQNVHQNSSATMTASVAHGKAITWRYKSSTSSGSYSGSYTTLSASSTVNCPVP